jgi:hypothetical protein
MRYNRLIAVYGKSYPANVAQLVEAVLQGEDSLYDACSPYILPPSAHGAKDALRAVQDLYVRIPRLVRLVRCATQHPDRVAAVEAIRLAQLLYSSSSEVLIRDVLGEEISTTRRLDSLIPNALETAAFDFHTLEGYVLATQYYTYRVLLCGLINTLCALDCARQAFDVEHVRGEDVAASTSIARCVDYALGGQITHPVRAMRLRLPLQVAFGAWHRLLERADQLSDTRLQLKKAFTMKLWTVEMLEKIDELWGSDEPTDYYRLEASCLMAAGGPRTPDLARWRDCR